MKKTFAIIAIAAAIIIAFLAGRNTGINHAVTRSEIWLASWEEAEHGDWIINIDLDGQTYTHELWVY